MFIDVPVISVLRPAGATGGLSASETVRGGLWVQAASGTLVPRLRLGTHCQAGSACLILAVGSYSRQK